MKKVYDWSYDAVKRIGDFAKYELPSPGILSSNQPGTTYVFPASSQGAPLQFVTPPPPTQNVNYQPPPSSNCPPPSSSTSQHMAALGQSNIQHNMNPNTGVANTGVAGVVSTASNQGNMFHTSPGKDGASPRKYVIMGPGGGYYQQMGADR